MNINVDKLVEYFKRALIGIGVILIYLLVPYLEKPFLELFSIDVSLLPDVVKHIVMASFEVLTLAIIMFIYRKDLEKDIKDIKKNHLSYFKKYFKYWLFAFIIMGISNVIIGIFNDTTTSGNEEVIRSMFSDSPIYVYFLSVFIAPFVEELVFRKAVKDIVPTKILFIIVSGLVFGGVHLIGNISSFIDYFYIIPYGIYGLTFAYIYAKTDNILISSSLHFMHNGLLMAIQLFILIFS